MKVNSPICGVGGVDERESGATAQNRFESARHNNAFFSPRCNHFKGMALRMSIIELVFLILMAI